MNCEPKPELARVAQLIADPARAAMLQALLGGRALTATELANVAGVTRQTASSHLGKMQRGGLLTVHRQGRHRYHCLSRHDVAEILERLMTLADTPPTSITTGPRDLQMRKSRVCYDHLAGPMAVRFFEHAVGRGWLTTASRNDETTSVALSKEGQVKFETCGIDVDALFSSKRSMCLACMDWSERRHHLAGALGAAVLQRCLDEGWARRPDDSRLVAFSQKGERQFADIFCST